MSISDRLNEIPRQYGVGEVLAAAIADASFAGDWQIHATTDKLEPTIEVGDIVSLVIGGPDMVALSYCADCGDVAVAWLDSDGDINTEVFPEEALL